MKPMNSLVLLKPHAHAGKAFAAGDRLDVDAVTAEWLLAQGVARINTSDISRSQPSQPSKPLKDSKP